MTNQYPVTGAVLDTSLDGTEQVEIVNGANALKTTTQAIANLASLGTIDITDGTHTVDSVTGLTFVGATVSGTAPNATATVNNQISGLTAGTVPKAASASTLANSAISDNGTDVTIAEPLILTGQTSTPGSSAGTLTNAPAIGNPQVWLQVSINGTVCYIPAWHV